MIRGGLGLKLVLPVCWLGVVVCSTICNGGISVQNTSRDWVGLARSLV